MAKETIALSKRTVSTGIGLLAIFAVLGVAYWYLQAYAPQASMRTIGSANFSSHPGSGGSGSGSGSTSSGGSGDTCGESGCKPCEDGPKSDPGGFAKNRGTVCIIIHGEIYLNGEYHGQLGLDTLVMSRVMYTYAERDVDAKTGKVFKIRTEQEANVGGYNMAVPERKELSGIIFPRLTVSNDWPYDNYGGNEPILYDLKPVKTSYTYKLTREMSGIKCDPITETIDYNPAADALRNTPKLIEINNAKMQCTSQKMGPPR